MKNKVVRGFQRFIRWLFGSPFRNLPPGMDEPVREIERFVAEVDEIQHRKHNNPAPTGESMPHHRSDTIRKK